MEIPPPSVYSTWPQPNYVNPVTRGNLKVILNICLYTILVCFIALRIYARTHLRKAFGADDIFILLALIPTTGFFIASVLADTKYHWTRHSWDMPNPDIPNGLKMVLATELMFAAACTLTKLSMLMLTRRMLESTSSFWRRVNIITITIVSIQGTIFCLTLIFQCHPISDAWRITDGPNPNCLNSTSSFLVAGIINTFTDFIVVLLPIRTVITLYLPRDQNIAVIGLFGLGFLSCGAGIARTYYTYMLSQNWDHIWASYPVWITAALELYVGIICASVPATKPFFAQVFSRNITSTKNYSRFTTTQFKTGDGDGD